MSPISVDNFGRQRLNGAVLRVLFCPQQLRMSPMLEATRSVTTNADDAGVISRRPAGLVPQADLDRLGRRCDAVGILYFSGHYALISLGAWLTWRAYPGVAFVPILCAHAFVIGFLFSPLHECAHGTAFRSRWLNETVLWITAIVYVVPPYFFRYFHLGHHRYTQMPGKDPSLVLPEPATFGQYLWYCAGLWFWWRNITWMVKHAFGFMDPSSTLYVPKGKRRLMVIEARVMVGLYTLIGVVALSAGFGTELMICWLLPRFLGEPIQRIVRVAEHVGCAESPDLLTNTRTTLSNWAVNAVAWQMPYHAEHHLFPNVPFHALPALHRLVASRVIVEPHGYIAGQRKIISMLRSGNRQSSGSLRSTRPML